MTTARLVPFATTLLVRDTCLCLHVQRAARDLARRFDRALQPVGLTNGQFSLLMALNRPEPARMGPLADLLGLERSTLTAALKPLEREGLIRIARDPTDGRGRLLTLTPSGEILLARAIPIWTAVHGELEASRGDRNLNRLRADLGALV